MNSSTRAEAMTGKVGIVLHSPWLYDGFVGLATLGRERRLRKDMLKLARVRPGESILDVGCGTGTLAIAAKRMLARGSVVQGVDASPEMLAQARRKAQRAHADVLFHQGTAQALPFPDGRFDAVLATMMLHHLPRSARVQVFREMRRVLTPNGRVFIADFGKPERRQGGLIDHLHRRHGHVDLTETASMLQEAGLSVVERGAVDMKDLQYILASASAHSEPAIAGADTPTKKPFRKLWLVAILVAIVIAAHGSLLHLVLAHTQLSVTLGAGVAVLIAIKHLPIVAPVVAMLRRRHLKDHE